jgi:hypothetical protein
MPLKVGKFRVFIGLEGVRLVCPEIAPDDGPSNEDKTASTSAGLNDDDRSLPVTE